IDAATVDAAHGDFETLALGAETVFHGNADIVESDGAGRLGIPAQLDFVFAEINAGQIGRNRKSGNAASAGAGFASARHHHQHFGGASAANKHFAAIDHIVVAIQFCVGAQGGGVGTGV